MKFSPIIAGTMRWGKGGADLPVNEVRNLIETSLEQGITSFDLADIYGGYTTEKLFGDALSGMGIERKKLQLISKCGIEKPCENRPYKVSAYNYSKQHIIQSLEQSLENLQTDYLDVLLLHRPSPLMDRREITAAFDVLKDQKMVKEFGVSNFTPSQFKLIALEFPLVTNQIEVSLTHTNAFYDGTLDQMMVEDLPPMAWSVMGSYFRNDSEQNARIREVMKPLCKKYDAKENQLLLAFVLKHPAKILPVIGTSKAETIQDLKDAVNIKMDHEDWFELLEAANGHRIP